MSLTGELWDMVAVGKPIKIFLETPGGEVIDMTGNLTQVEVTVEQGLPNYLGDIGRPMGFDLHIQGTEMLISQRENYVEKIHSASEWVCAYCDHANPIAATYCGELDEHVVGCNAARPVVYDL